jgi:hypothetical protein
MVFKGIASQQHKIELSCPGNINSTRCRFKALRTYLFRLAASVHSPHAHLPISRMQESNHRTLPLGEQI